MIAIDWGTTSLRAYRLDADGIQERRHDPRGILACEGRYAEVLAELIGDWPGEILLCGMIGSRNGWIELPYLPAPAEPAALAAAMLRHEDARFPGRGLWFVPGLACGTGADAVPDVMRGEETQLVGLLQALGPGRHLACLPGTHSKWAWLEDGRLGEFATVMTGELYAVLRQHSLLGRLIDDADAAFDEAAFLRGVDRAGQPGGLTHHLFGTRTLGLFDRLSPRSAGAYLSGLLIGEELQARGDLPGEIHLVGGAQLSAHYALALSHRGVRSRSHGEALAATGLQRLAHLRGLAA